LADQEGDLDSIITWATDEYLGSGVFKSSREILIRELRKTLLSIVDNLLEETNQKEPEFKPELLAPKRKINTIIEAPLSKARALLIPQIGGFILKIRSNMHPFQKRFSCAHEIGHTFFFNIKTDPPRRDFQYQKSRYWVEEELSNVVAREILVPTFSIREMVQKNGIPPSIGALRYLSNVYQVSFDVLRPKLVTDTFLWDSVIFKAQVLDDKVIVRQRDISKGISYRDVHIPRVIEKNSHCELFTDILLTVKREHLKDREVILKGKKYRMETLLLKYKKPVVTCVLTSK
jgi:Zn-dependent peptidase ImmA (M78 family)